MTAHGSKTADSAAGDLYAALLKVPRREAYQAYTLVKTDAGKAAMAAVPSLRVALVRLTMERLAELRKKLGSPKDEPGKYRDLAALKEYPLGPARMLEALFQKPLPFTAEDFTLIVDRLARLELVHWKSHGYLPKLVDAVEAHIAKNGPTAALNAAIGRLLAAMVLPEVEPEQHALMDRLAGLQVGTTRIHITPGEAWSDKALADLAGMGAALRIAWTELLRHCEGSKSGCPSDKWLEAAREGISRVGPEELKRRVLAWFPLVDKPRTRPLEGVTRWNYDPTHLIGETHGDILKGLAWCCSLKEDPELARALTALAISSYRKVPQIGPRLVRVGNACVWALGAMPGNEGVGQLAILRVRVKFGTAQKGIEKALNATAERVGVPREELEEMSVPAYGMSEVGLRREELGEFAAELAVVGSGTELRWLRADGKPQKTMPAAVKKDHAEDVTELKTAAKDIQRMLGAQRERLDSLNLAQKSWPLVIWRERYLDHPLVGTLARRLIWVFREKRRATNGIWCDGELVDSRSKPISSLSSDAIVELWHPIGRDMDEIVAWRRWLEGHEVQQPFKQAHREIYLLTDAERSTRTYSNRFAAHIIRQHQFNSLCAVRGWKNKLRLMVDAEFPPATLLLPKWNLRAEFWVDSVGQDYGSDTNETGVFHYLATDQVRFYPSSALQGDPDNPLPLEDIPPLVLSEVMRDVDLFVGVCSVGNDPNWADGGPDGRYGDYWASYAFGVLTESAKTRREVLERLIPRLAIAERCSFTERFLVVRGDLRTYKIHLGSGNIRMEPNDQYLCIVKAPEREGAGRVFLPFEGDGMLAIILSKAMLLADDRKIKDATILRQIKKG